MARYFYDTRIIQVFDDIFSDYYSLINVTLICYLLLLCGPFIKPCEENDHETATFLITVIIIIIIIININIIISSSSSSSIHSFIHSFLCRMNPLINAIKQIFTSSACNVAIFYRLTENILTVFTRTIQCTSHLAGSYIVKLSIIHGHPKTSGD